jgi:7,8-dihydropterin-6-yl-methyl-4-(beta-D-ribofuranosyl)aminobenzene 5'-phosphate synthase
MRITVLAENTVCETNSLNGEAENELSLFIEFDERVILFDTGQSDIFFRNAGKMGIDLSEVDYLVICNGHFDPGGGLRHFFKINKKAKVFLHVNVACNYYSRIFGFIPDSMVPNQKIIAQNSRIYFIEEDTRIDDKTILIDGFTEVFPQLKASRALFEKTNNRLIADKLNYELAMLLIENEEAVLFSGCSHSEILNHIEEVKVITKKMRIKATFGLTEERGEPMSIFNKWHGTGENKLWHMKSRMPEKIQTLNTGEVIEI